MGKMPENRKYTISDVVNDDFIRFPVTLLANPMYRELSLEAKFVYALLLNRLTLSQKNGWINEDKEVYLIYTREEVADTLNISYKKAIAAFKDLIAVGLLEETRQGRGYPNLLYVLKVELQDSDAEQFKEDYDGFNTSKPGQETPEIANTSRPADSAHQDLPKPHIKTCGNGISKPAVTAYQDLPKPQASKTDSNYPDTIQLENSQSICPKRRKRRQTDRQEEQALEIILDSCELELFAEPVREMLRGAVERLYYSTELHIGNAVLPQARIRSYLHLLTADHLIASLETMRKNEKQIQNPTAYMMSVIFNAICEEQSDLILSLPPEYQTGGDFYASQ